MLSWVVIFESIVVLLVAQTQPTLAFAPSAGTVSNFTTASSSTIKKQRAPSSRWMMPLRLDDKLHRFSRRLDATTSSSAQQQDEQSNVVNNKPRGIVLNASVGALTFAGGLMGFLTKKSKASLMAGSTFGGLLMLSAYLISYKKNSTTGNKLGSSVAGMLTYVMGKKFMASKKFMPAGLIALLGGVAFVYNIIEVIVVSSNNAEEVVGGNEEAEQNKNDTPPVDPKAETE